MSYEDPSITPEVVRHACGVGPDDPELPDYVRMMDESREWMMEPLRQPGPFDFGDGAHFQRGMDWFARVMRARQVRAHPMYVYWNRSVFGLMALLFRLGAQVDIHVLVSQERPGGLGR
jgi:hypothetical protein